jgi:hypothetical protein
MRDFILKLLRLLKVKLAITAAFCNGIAEVKCKSHYFGYAPVAVHCHIAEQFAGFVINAEFLPCIDKGAVMEIYAEGILIGIDVVHIKGLYPQIAYKNLSEILTVFRICTTLPEDLAVDLPAAFDRPPDDRLGIDAGFDHFIMQDLHSRIYFRLDRTILTIKAAVTHVFLFHDAFSATKDRVLYYNN